jgi:hypothetical protein
MKGYTIIWFIHVYLYHIIHISKWTLLVDLLPTRSNDQVGALIGSWSGVFSRWTGWWPPVVQHYKREVGARGSRYEVHRRRYWTPPLNPNLISRVVLWATGSTTGLHHSGHHCHSNYAKPDGQSLSSTSCLYLSLLSSCSRSQMFIIPNARVVTG